MAEARKVFLITGASRGIGHAIFCHVSAQYSDVVVVGTATKEEGAQELTEKAHEKGWLGFGVRLDVTDYSACQLLVRSLQEKHGAVLGLVNNAGVTRDNLAVMMKDDEWHDVIATDLTAPFFLARLVLKPMMRARWGRIVNISSVVACSGNPGQANYVSAKSGLIGLSKSLALEMGSRRITVNCVAPGFIDTEMTQKLTEPQRLSITARIPLGYIGEPHDVASAVSFLLSEEARYITGNTIHVNGGLYLS